MRDRAAGRPARMCRPRLALLASTSRSTLHCCWWAWRWPPSSHSSPALLSAASRAAQVVDSVAPPIRTRRSCSSSAQGLWRQHLWRYTRCGDAFSGRLCSRPRLPSSSASVPAYLSAQTSEGVHGTLTPRHAWTRHRKSRRLRRERAPTMPSARQWRATPRTRASQFSRACTVHSDRALSSTFVPSGRSRVGRWPAHSSSTSLARGSRSTSARAVSRKKSKS
jgi:hypothetical protein